MTVAEKSTETGEDLAQLWWDNAVKDDCFKSDIWDCTCVTGIVPSTELQRGSAMNNYYYDSAGDEAVTEATTLAELEVICKVWIDLQNYSENPIPEVRVPKTA